MYIVGGASWSVREWSSPGSTESWPGHCVVSLVTVYLYSTFTGVSRHGYLNPYIKFKLIELAITLYQEFWNEMNYRIFHNL